MKFIPLYERVLVQVMEGQKSIGEFMLPDNARDDFLIGVVVSTGEGYINEEGKLRPLRVKEGMQVVFGPYAGTKVQIDGQEFLLMKEGELGGRFCFKAEGKPCGSCAECLADESHLYRTPAEQKAHEELRNMVRRQSPDRPD